MREKRKGPISIAGGLVDSVAATVRRMQRDREPRALVYDPTGYARLIQPEARGHARILEIAEAMVAQAGSDGPARPTKEAAEERSADEAKTKRGNAKPTKARASRQAKTASRKAEKAAAKPTKRSAGATKARTAKGKAAPDATGPRKQRARRSRPEKT